MNRRSTPQERGPSRPAERFDRGIWASIVLHVVLGVLLVTSPALFPAFGDIPWGSESGGGGGISVNLVDASGIPLPAAPVTRPDAVGNESEGLYSPVEDAAPPESDEVLADAEPIPETFPEEATPEEVPEPPVEVEARRTEPEPVRPSPAPNRTSSSPTVPTPAVPDNAVPFGEGGQPDIGAGFATTGGTYGLDVGDGTFGQQYGRYVNAMRRRVSENWYQSMVDANVPSGQRVTLEFDIQRSGVIQNVRVVQSSGVRSLDDSAERAIYRVQQLEPLPPTYRGGSIHVQFWFEFTR